MLPDLKMKCLEDAHTRYFLGHASLELIPEVLERIDDTPLTRTTHDIFEKQIVSVLILGVRNDTCVKSVFFLQADDVEV